MLNLAFDTTAGSCSVILTEDGKTVGKIIEKMDFGQAEALFPAIEKIMLEDADVQEVLDEAAASMDNLLG